MLFLTLNCSISAQIFCFTIFINFCYDSLLTAFIVLTIEYGKTDAIAIYLILIFDPNLVGYSPIRYSYYYVTI